MRSARKYERSVGRPVVRRLVWEALRRVSGWREAGMFSRARRRAEFEAGWEAHERWLESLDG